MSLSELIRLRVTVHRLGVPEVKLVWPCSPSHNLTVANLLAQIDAVVPLEAGEWGLEDYALELDDGRGGRYECLHFQQVGQALRDEDQLLIRPLLSQDLKRRQLSGRHQISVDGKHLIDGLAFGLPWLRSPRTRPALELPPRKRTRGTNHKADNFLNLHNDEADGDGSVRAVGHLLPSGTASLDDDGRLLFLGHDDGAAGNKKNFWLGKGRLQEALDDEFLLDCDDDDNGSDEKDSDSPDGENEPDLAEELQLLARDNLAVGHGLLTEAPNPFDMPLSTDPEQACTGNNSLKLSLPNAIAALRVAFPGIPATSIEVELLRNARDLSKAYSALRRISEPALSCDQMMEVASLHMGSLDQIGWTESQRMHQGAHRNENDPERPLIEVIESDEDDGAADATESDDASPLPVPNIGPGGGNDSPTNVTADSSSSSTSDDGEDDDRTSDSNSTSTSEDATSSESSDDDDSESGDSVTNESVNSKVSTSNASSSSGSDESEDSARRQDGRKTHVLSIRDDELTRKGPAGSVNDDGLEKAKELQQKSGSLRMDAAAAAVNSNQERRQVSLTKTQKRNARRRKMKTLQRLAAFEPNGTSTNGTTTAEAGLEEAKKKLLRAIASETFGEEDNKGESQTQPLQEAADEAAQERVERSADSKESRGPHRSRVDMGVGRRLLFGALGLRTPKTKDEEEKIKQKLMEGVRPHKSHTTFENGTGGDESSAATDEVSEDWRLRVNYRAVECCYEGVVLSEPPFPFVQRWDRQQQPGSERKRKRMSQELYEADYENDDGSELLLVEPQGSGKRSKQKMGSEMNGSTECDSANRDGTLMEPATALNGPAIRDDLPTLPMDLSTLPELEPGAAREGMVISWKQLALSKATGWQPQIAQVTGLVLSAGDDESNLHVVLAKRDRDQKQKVYDEKTGQRIYGKFEMPDWDSGDEGEEEDDGHRMVSRAEMTEPRVVQDGSWRRTSQGGFERADIG